MTGSSEYLRGNDLDYRYVYGFQNLRLSVNISPIDGGAGSIVETGTMGEQIRLYYHQDLRGTVDYLTSPVSQKVESWTHYNEWGEITHNAVVKCGYREFDLVKHYTGHEYDAVLNLYYAKARMYDAENRRFTSVDPILDASRYDISEYVTNPMQLVQYLYVQNNPLIFVDPTGLFFEELGEWVSNTWNSALDWTTKEIETVKTTITKQFYNLVNSLYEAIGPITKHITNSERREDLERDVVTALIINAGDSGSLVLQALINVGSIAIGQLPSMEYYNEYLKTASDFDKYSLGLSKYKDSYYVGKMLGDIIVTGIGIGLTAKGISDVMSGATAAAGGTATAATGVGVIVAAGGAALTASGVAEGAAGIAIAAVGISNFGGNKNIFDYYKKLACQEFNKKWNSLLEKCTKLNNTSAQTQIYKK